jgi:primosomal protein N' (replication factor Y)
LQRYADIVFPAAVRQAFTYAVPSRLKGDLKPGMRVWVPFQRRRTIGLIVKLHDQKPSFNTRNIERKLDKEPILSSPLLQLTHWIHRFYYCGWGEVIQAALPAGLNFYAEQYVHVSPNINREKLNEKEKEVVDEISQSEKHLLKEAKKRWAQSPYKNILKNLIKKGSLEVWEEPVQKETPKTVKQWHWSPQWTSDEINELLDGYAQEGKRYKWIQALERLTELDLPKLQTTLTEYDLLDHYTLNRIAKEGIIEAQQAEVTGFDLDLPYEPDAINPLNEEQQEAFNQVSKPMEEVRYECFLLYGVTGSGKTEVYIHALKKALDAGKGGLILVPEISLTPQTVKRFYQIFGDDIAVLHSRLSIAERQRAWKALKSGEKRIAIGARSAVFAPVQNLGLIVVDEEHDLSYKQKDPAPRYHARETAIMRAYQTDAVIILGTATPGMRALHMAREGKSKMLTLSKRHEGAALPEVKVLDLKQYKTAMRGPLAVPLYEAIEEALDKDEQIILLQNRRGFSSYLQCEDCGHIPECPHCSVSLTYHRVRQQLRCHYCGYSSNIPYYCNECSSYELIKKGTGTQQIEEQITELFPGAAICRMDYDTTAGRNSHREIFGRFDRGEIDILLGTQIVAKGLDFPNVTVVGVINADTELAFPSFRAGERMYQLLSQVAGRSGRAEKAGRVYFQSWQSDHYAIQCAKEHDHQRFARHEMSQRKMLDYPPYTRLINFQFKAKDGQRVAKIAHAFTNCLRAIAGSRPVLGPSPSTIIKMQGWFRWECLVKMENDASAAFIEHFLDVLFKRYQSEKPKGASSVRINVNVDALE